MIGRAQGRHKACPYRYSERDGEGGVSKVRAN